MPTGQHRVGWPPLMLLLVILVVHRLWAHADHVAQTIAQHGQASTRAIEGTGAGMHAPRVADQLRGDLAGDDHHRGPHRHRHGG